MYPLGTNVLLGGVLADPGISHDVYPLRKFLPKFSFRLIVKTALHDMFFKAIRT